jgi:hypothetical protein
MDLNNFRGYGFGIAKPSKFVPVAIPIHMPQPETDLLLYRAVGSCYRKVLQRNPVRHNHTLHVRGGRARTCAGRAAAQAQLICSFVHYVVFRFKNNYIRSIFINIIFATYFSLNCKAITAPPLHVRTHHARRWSRCDQSL